MEAFSTGDAVLFSKRFDLRGITMFRYIEHIRSWNIDTGMDATKTHDASIRPLSDEGGPIFKKWMLDFLGDELHMVDPKFIGAVLELAFSSSITDGTVQRMVDQQQFQSFEPHLLDALRAGMHYHPLDHRRRTRSHGHLRTLHIDQTDTTGFDEAQLGVITQGGNIDSILFGEFKDRLIRSCRNFFPVNRQL